MNGKEKQTAEKILTMKTRRATRESQKSREKKNDDEDSPLRDGSHNPRLCDGLTIIELARSCDRSKETFHGKKESCLRGLWRGKRERERDGRRREDLSLERRKGKMK